MPGLDGPTQSTDASQGGSSYRSFCSCDRSIFKLGEEARSAERRNPSFRRRRVVGQFECVTLPHWKMDGPWRIFREWRQLSDAIAAPRCRPECGWNSVWRVL